MTQAESPLSEAVQSFAHWFHSPVAIQLVRPLVAIEPMKQPGTKKYQSIGGYYAPTFNPERPRPLIVLLGVLRPAPGGKKLIVKMSLEPGVITEVLLGPEQIDYVQAIAEVPASAPEAPRVIVP